MQTKHFSMSLARILGPDDHDSSSIEIVFFQFTLTTKLEDGKTVAIFQPLERKMVGVGDCDEEAIEDFVECFKCSIDMHIEEKTLRDLLENPVFQQIDDFQVKETPLPIEEEDQDMFLSTFPVWQRPEPVGHAHAA